MRILSKNQWLKILLAVLVFSFLLFPNLSQAADLRCWAKKDCREIRKTLDPDMTAQEQLEGFFRSRETKQVCGDKDAEGSELGFCLPVGKTVTAVKFGGKAEFSHLGDFIQYIYRYGVIAAGILAVLIIIHSGFMWVISGGNAEAITRARKRLAGAMMGLFIAVMSYVVLNTINPYLVNLRMPQVWLLRSVELVGDYCDEMQDSEFALAKKSGEQVSNAELKTRYESAVSQGGFKSYSAIKPGCGNEYFTKEGGALTCIGTVCGENQVCTKQGKEVFKCETGLLAGSIKAAPQLLCKDLAGNIINNDLKLIAMCKNGDIDEIDIYIVKDNGRHYVFPPSIKPDVEKACSGKDGLAGFYLGAEVNDESGLLCQITGSGIGEDDWHAIGKSSAKKCNVNLAKVGYKILNGKDPDCSGDNGIKNCSCGSISDEPILKQLANNPDFTKHLISASELLNGYRCDIYISRGEFPDIDNASYTDWSCFYGDPTRCWCKQDIF